MKQSKALYITYAAITAALYIVLTFISSLLGLSSGIIQVRISEALCFLPMYTSAAIPGLAIGCLIANLITGSLPLDILCGTLATLIGAVFAYLLKKYKYLTVIPNIISNTLIIPFVLAYVYSFEGSIYYFMLTVGVGEIISSGVIGIALIYIIEHRRHKKSTNNTTM